jgi:hypothetical protein
MQTPVMAISQYSDNFSRSVNGGEYPEEGNNRQLRKEDSPAWINLIAVYVVHCMRVSRDSSVGIATGYGPDNREFGTRFPAEARDFSLIHTVQTSLGPTQPPIQCVTDVLSPGVRWKERDLTTHLHLVPRLRMVELYLHSLIYLHGVM